MTLSSNKNWQQSKTAPCGSPGRKTIGYKLEIGKLRHHELNYGCIIKAIGLDNSEHDVYKKILVINTNASDNKIRTLKSYM